MITLLVSRHVVTPSGIIAATVVIEDGRIARIEPATGSTAGARSSADSPPIDLGDAWLLPGFVDTHVHVNDPGRTEWEGFDTATRAAAMGGITTLVDMPLNSIPATTRAEALSAKRTAARGKLHVDAGFWGGVVPGNAGDLPALAQAGVRGFKCFLVPSGVDEFPGVTEADLDLALPVIAKLGLPLLVHAELPGPIEAARASLASADPRAYATWLASRPRASEVEAIRLVIRLATRYECRMHIVHLATSEALDDLREARESGVPVTVETCPHYLTFCAEEIADGATPFKCAPPIRERAERERLWAALRDGTIDFVATDHSPCPPDLKRLDRGNFMSAWGGIASLEMSLATMWTGARARGFSAVDLARWMSESPARLAGLDARKGAIAPGRDADFVVWNPDAEWTVVPERLAQRHKLTPYAGLTLAGRVEAVFLRGTRIVDGGRLVAEARGTDLIV